MKILDYSPDERPREKMIMHGPESLSDSELVAILLRTGTVGTNAMDTARKLLGRAGHSLLQLSAISMKRMCEVEGVGTGKATTLAAALEISRRIALERADKPKNIVNSSEDAFLILNRLMENEDKEECRCLFLKRSRRILATLKISEGGATLTEIDIKKIVRAALDTGASFVILSHNHPSGNPHPSVADIRLTEQLGLALRTFEMELLDHIILAENDYYSFADNFDSKPSKRSSPSKSGKKWKNLEKNGK